MTVNSEEMAVIVVFCLFNNIIMKIQSVYHHVWQKMRKENVTEKLELEEKCFPFLLENDKNSCFYALVFVQ